MVSLLLKMKDIASNAALVVTASAPELWLWGGITLVFAALGRLVRGVTNSGAVAGAIVCFALLIGTGWSGFAALCSVFLVTWMATRFGHARKQVLGTAEASAGRTAAQVFANLGVAAGCAIIFAVNARVSLKLAVGAALCEAAADTVSSEVGQAIGGTPRLVTNWHKVKPGSNGAVTITGTIAGVLAVIVVAAVYGLLGRSGWHGVTICAGAGIAGTIADSLLGATIERKGFVGNNAVNLVSTFIAATIGFALG